MDKQRYTEHIQGEIDKIKQSGLYKVERVIASPQQPHIQLADGSSAINFCANNYLGLANHPTLIEAAKKSYDNYGFGLSSVRFICGTQVIHRALEERLSNFLGTDETILYSSCYDANGGLFEALLGEEDAIISDCLNHASIIDGVRLCKARRLRYANNDMAALEAQLQAASDCRFRMIATDGVFSMDGSIANLMQICDLADHYDALVMVDDSHATGFMGKEGRGTPEYCGVSGRIDILTGTLGKALGGASGGYTSANATIIALLRQRSRPYLFSNTLAPAVVAASVAAIDLLSKSGELRERLHANSRYFREKLSALGFNLLPGSHPIIPVMFGDAVIAQQFASEMLRHGIYVIAFSYPVVPQGKARIRTQMSAAHSLKDLDRALEAFKIVGKMLKVI